MKKLLAALLFTLLAAPAHAACTAGTLPFTLQNNTTADATQVMANFDQIVTSVGTNCAGSGVNSDITAITGLTTPLSYTQGGTSVYIGGTSTGTANAQVVASPTPIGYSLTAGKQICFIAGATNTTATTFNFNSTGATAVRKNGHAGLEALTGGEIVTGNTICAWYNGTYHVLTTTPFSDLGTLTNIASATTTDLGTVSTHNANITGTTTITSFGSSAVATEPIYFIKFAGALTLTYNATSLLIPSAANITTAANDTAIVEYLGSGNWQVRQYTKYTGTAIVNPTPLCGASGFTLVNNSGTPNTNIDYAAASAVLVNPTGNVPIYVTSVSGTVNTTNANVINGIDTSRVAGTVYHFYLMSNGTSTGGYMSTSATGGFGTTPSGYIYYCRLGSMMTNPSANFFASRTMGNWTQYTTPRLITSGASGSNCTGVTITWGTALTISNGVGVSATTNYVPSTASQIGVIGASKYNNGTISYVCVAPNTNYGSILSTTPPPIGVSGAVNASQTAIFGLEATTIQYVGEGGSGAAVFVYGWRDTVNAN